MLFASITELATELPKFIYPFFRILALFSVAPIFGSRMVSIRIRVGLTLLVCVVVVQAGLVASIPDLSNFSLVALVQEIAIGLSMGFVLRLVFGALELGAQVISLQMGLGFAELISPQTGVSEPTLAQFYVVTASLLFLSMDGHHLVVVLVGESFAVLPVGADVFLFDRLKAVVAFGSVLFKASAMVALTATVAMLSVNLIVGVVTRAAPQFNMFVAFPAILIVGLVVLSLSLAALPAQLRQIVEMAVKTVRQGILGI